MAKQKEKENPIMSNGKKVGILLFLGGFLFAAPIIAGAGAVLWGGITIVEVVRHNA